MDISNASFLERTTRSLSGRAAYSDGRLEVFDWS